MYVKKLLHRQLKWTKTFEFQKKNLIYDHVALIYTADFQPWSQWRMMSDDGTLWSRQKYKERNGKLIALKLCKDMKKTCWFYQSCKLFKRLQQDLVDHFILCKNVWPKFQSSGRNLMTQCIYKKKEMLLSLSFQHNWNHVTSVSRSFHL